MSRDLDARQVKFSPEADARLKRLKAKTGITPNLLCRVGFCMSLEEPGTPQSDQYPPGDRVINRYTLTGPYDALFVALLRQRMFEDGLGWDEASEQFRAHMNRGVLLLNARVGSTEDLLAAIPGVSEQETLPLKGIDSSGAVTA